MRSPAKANHPQAAITGYFTQVTAAFPYLAIHFLRDELNFPGG